MRYRVYAANDDMQTMFHRMEAKCDTLALDNAIEFFEKCVRELKFFNVWLIADFEKATKPKKGLFRKEKPVKYFTEDSDDMNFFPICEYHFDANADNLTGKSAKDCVRHDLIEMNRGNIKIMFTDNLEAMEQMEWDIQNRVAVSYTFTNKMIKYILDEPVHVDVRRTIVDTVTYLNRDKSEMHDVDFVDLDSNYIISNKIDKKVCNYVFDKTDRNDEETESFIPAHKIKEIEDVSISAVVG